MPRLSMQQGDCASSAGEDCLLVVPAMAYGVDALDGLAVRAHVVVVTAVVAVEVVRVPLRALL